MSPVKCGIMLAVMWSGMSVGGVNGQDNIAVSDKDKKEMASSYSESLLPSANPLVGGTMDVMLASEPQSREYDEAMFEILETRTPDISSDLIGAAVGGIGLGLATMVAICRVDDANECEDARKYFLGGFVVGAIIGAGVGSAF